MFKTTLQQKGFTLLELLLYVSLASILLVSTSLFMSTLLESRVKNQTIAEVEQQGIQAMNIITQTVRNASVIIAPTQGVIGTSLSVNTYTALLNPTIFDVAGDALRIKEGTGPTVSLTNSKVMISNLTFTNLTRPTTPGTIRIQFTLSYINTLGRNELNFSKTFISTATLRQP